MNPLSAAKELCRQSNWTYRQMDVSKVLFVCQVLWLGRHGIKNPLVYGHFTAESSGPEHAALEKFFRAAGSKPIPKEYFKDVDDVESKDRISLLAEMVKKYPAGSMSDLGWVVRADGYAWQLNHVPGIEGLAISNRDMLNEHKKRVEDAQKRAEKKA